MGSVAGTLAGSAPLPVLIVSLESDVRNGDADTPGRYETRIAA